MLKIDVLIFNPFQENTYILSDETGECVVVDAGNYGPAEDRRLAEFVTAKSLKPVLAINTHGHVDHILGVGFAKKHFGIPFGLHQADTFLVESAQTHGALYGFNVGEVPVIDFDLSEMPRIEFGNSVLRIIETPGHTPGHVCFYHEESKTLLTGDTLFRESIGRTDLPGGDYSWIMRSILDRIMPLGGDVSIYPGHGPSSTLGHEALYNPFITEVLGGEVNCK